MRAVGVGRSTVAVEVAVDDVLDDGRTQRLPPVLGAHPERVTQPVRSKNDAAMKVRNAWGMVGRGAPVAPHLSEGARRFSRRSDVTRRGPYPTLEMEQAAEAGGGRGSAVRCFLLHISFASHRSFVRSEGGCEVRKSVNP